MKFSLMYFWYSFTLMLSYFVFLLILSSLWLRKRSKIYLFCFIISLYFLFLISLLHWTVRRYFDSNSFKFLKLIGKNFVWISYNLLLYLLFSLLFVLFLWWLNSLLNQIRFLRRIFFHHHEFFPVFNSLFLFLLRAFNSLLTHLSLIFLSSFP